MLAVFMASFTNTAILEMKSNPPGSIIYSYENTLAMVL